MNTSTIEARRSPGKRLGIFALGLAVACAGMFGLASSKAEAGTSRSAVNDPFTMELNDGLLNLGAAFVGQEILPAPAKLGGTTTLPNWWDIVESTLGSGGTNPCVLEASPYYPCGANPSSAQISAVGGAGNLAPAEGGSAAVAWPFGTQSTWNPSTGAIALNRVVGAGQSPSGTPFNYDVRFPIMVVPSPLDGDPIPITLAATGAVTGTYNPIDGALELAPAGGSSLEARVLVGLGIPTGAAGGPQPFTYCSVPLPGATLSTAAGSGSAAFTSGSPFTSGLEGAGALQASYTVAGTSTPVTQAGVSGGAAAAAAAALEQCATVDLVTQGAGGIWFGNRTEVPACKDNEIGVYPDCVVPEANISKIAVTGSSKVKRGKKVKLTVKVTNSGTADKSVKVGIFTSQSGLVKAPGSVTVNAPAGSTGSKKITVTAKKKKGKVTISASNGERTGKRTVTVK